MYFRNPKLEMAFFIVCVCVCGLYFEPYYIDLILLIFISKHNIIHIYNHVLWD